MAGREDALSFIDDQGMVSLLAGTELPSIQEAIEGDLVDGQEEGTIKSGFGIAWIWARDLPDQSKCMFCLLLRERGVFIARRHWAALVATGSPDHHHARKARRISAGAYQLADYLETKGPASAHTLRDALGYTGRTGGQTFRRIRRELEKQRLIVASGIEQMSGSDPYIWTLTRDWAPPPVFEEAAGLSRRKAMSNLLLAGIDAALAVDERAVYRWFGWSRSMTASLIKELLKKEACFRVEGSPPILISQTLVDVWPKA